MRLKITLLALTTKINCYLSFAVGDHRSENFALLFTFTLNVKTKRDDHFQMLISAFLFSVYEKPNLLFP